MGALHIRDIDNEQLKAWKRSALDSGQTLKEWVLARLGVGVPIAAHIPKWEPLTSVQAIQSGAEKLRAIGCMDFVDDTAQYEAQKRTKQVHKPKDCRLYGCMMCKEAGHKDAARGL